MRHTDGARVRPGSPRQMDITVKYREHQRLRGLLPRTIEKNTRAVRQFLEYTEGVLPTMPEDVEAFLGTRSVEARTRYWWISCLHTFYRWAVRYGHATSDPTVHIDRPKLRPLLPRPIATADLAMAFEMADTQLRAMLSLMAFEGLRCQEVAGMQRAEVLDSLADPVLIVVQGKGAKQRVVPLHDDTLLALRALPMPARGYIFRRADGRPLPPWMVSHLVRNFLHSIGVEASAHQLRHWYGTECYRLSRDLRMVQELLGHASPTTTAGYTKLDPADAVPIVRRLTVRRPADATEPPPENGRGLDGRAATQDRAAGGLRSPVTTGIVPGGCDSTATTSPLATIPPE